MTYEVVVGNIGTVYSGAGKHAAMESYERYVAMSKDGWIKTRASGEPVTLFENGEIIAEYHPTAVEPE